uniref:Calcineurin-like phosphoesterase domain-containing protein n=1 Tax=viral metagenome TaxID=1070528 RepID=A0A6C0BDH9_9ZZZZ
MDAFLRGFLEPDAGIKKPAAPPAPAPPAPVNKDPFANLVANLGVKNSPLPTLQVKDSWDSAKASEFLITSADMRDLTGNVEFGVYAMSNLIKNKITPLSELVDRNFIVDASKYPTVYITSDIHSDVRKFIQMLQGAGLLDLGSLNDIYKLDTIYNPALFDQIEWTGGAGTLLVIVGDLVDGKRINKTHINDPKGSFEFLLHTLLYNLKIKALNAGSDVRFTIGNHDFDTIIGDKQGSLYTSYVTDEAKIFFNKNYNTRRNALLPFYKISPFYLLSIELGGIRQVLCVHGGLHSITENYSGKLDVIDYTEIIRNLQEEVSGTFTPGGAENFFPDKATTLFPNPQLREQPGPLWSRSYAQSISDKHCAEIAKTGYKLVVVGHCPTNSGFSRTEAVMSGDKVAYAECEHSSYAPVGDGCVILDCIHSNRKPKLAFVDVALSYGFRSQGQIDEMGSRSRYPDSNELRTVEILKLTNVNTSDFTIERKKVVVDVASLTPTMAGGRSRSKRTQRRSNKNASRKRRVRGTLRSLRKRSHSRQRR